MKKIYTAAALLLTLCLSLTAAFASGETLVSLSYLEETFSQTLNDTITARLDAAGQDLRSTLRRNAGGNATLKEDDTLDASAGLTFTPLGGSVRLSLSGGAVIDVTEGRETPPGPLEEGHRYLVAENTSARFTVSSPAAVVSWEGPGTLTPSARPDCYAIAGALWSLDLFRGTGSGFGDGFDLYRAPTRGEGLVLFLRILGEEADALACTDGHPFADVPGWLEPYVAWAYRQGYSNGVSAAAFDPDRPISAPEFVELMLRALGYSTAGTDDYASSLERGLECGALTSGEYAALSGSPFLRAHAAYLAYYSLDTLLSGTQQTLAQRMISAGLFTGEQLASARSRVETLRLT